MVEPPDSSDPNPRIQIVHSERGDRVALIGQIDLANARETESALIDAASDGGPLTLDLLGLTYLDSQGVAMLLRLAERARLNGGSLTLANPRGMVLRVLQLTHMGEAAAIIVES